MRLGMFIALGFALMLSLWSTPSVAAQIGSSHGTAVVALQQPSGGRSLGHAGRRQLDIGPAGEAVFEVPGRFAVADHHEFVHRADRSLDEGMPGGSRAREGGIL